MENKTALRSWLKREGRKAIWLAEQLGVSSWAVSQWLAGNSIPQPGNRSRLETITAGAVPANGWGK